jgi:hypothetical protein
VDSRSILPSLLSSKVNNTSIKCFKQKFSVISNSLLRMNRIWEKIKEFKPLGNNFIFLSALLTPFPIDSNSIPFQVWFPLILKSLIMFGNSKMFQEDLTFTLKEHWWSGAILSWKTVKLSNELILFLDKIGLKFEPRWILRYLIQDWYIQ